MRTCALQNEKSLLGRFGSTLDSTMRSRHWNPLTVGCLALLLVFPRAAPALAVAEGAAPRAVVLRDREAGRHSIRKIPSHIQKDTTIEPSISVNPEDPRHAVTIYMQGRSSLGCHQGIGFATTRDGGKSWAHGNLPGLTTATGGTYPSAKDPVVAFGENDTVYAVAVLCTEGNEADLAFNVSTDGGLHWEDASLVPPAQSLPIDDKPWIVVDNSDAPGHHLGRIYLVWDGVDPVVASYSDDGAETWHGPFVVFAGAGIGAIPLIRPNGDLAVVFKAFYLSEESDLEAIAIAPGAGAVPTGGPLVFGEAVVIAEDQGGPVVRQQRAAGNVPTADIDPESGRIYVAWADTRFRQDNTQDIVISSSEDGISWTEPAKVNRGSPDNYVDHFAPWIAVGSEGSVRISYRTQQEAEDLADFKPYVNTWYQASTDDAASFSRPMKVNQNVRSDVRFAATAENKAFFGEYAQIAAAGSWTYIARCEAFPLTDRERRAALFPPRVHHQRTWVAVVDSDGNGKP